MFIESYNSTHVLKFDCKVEQGGVGYLIGMEKEGQETEYGESWWVNNEKPWTTDDYGQIYFTSRSGSVTYWLASPAVRSGDLYGTPWRNKLSSCCCQWRVLYQGVKIAKQLL